MTEPQPRADSAAQTVIEQPAEIDRGNAEQVGEALAAAMHPGLKVVIADLTATTFCDLPGARVFAMARRQAIENGTALRLVVPSRAVRLVFQITELDRLVPIYASLSAALAPEMDAASPAAAASPWLKRFIPPGRNKRKWPRFARPLPQAPHPASEDPQPGLRRRRRTRWCLPTGSAAAPRFTSWTAAAGRRCTCPSCRPPAAPCRLSMQSEAARPGPPRPRLASSFSRSPRPRVRPHWPRPRSPGGGGGEPDADRRRQRTARRPAQRRTGHYLTGVTIPGAGIRKPAKARGRCSTVP
jgi:anti-anti-sigma factor